MTDAWSPAQYHRFADERRQPFVDLLAGIAPVPGGRALDLGCGAGALTRELCDHVQAADTVGVDSSAAMLAEAAALARPGLSFTAGDMVTYAPAEPVDVLVANAALQWAPHHAKVLARWASFLRPGGQLAVQMPANADHPSHMVSTALAADPRFAARFGADGPPPDPVASNVLAPEAYAQILHGLGLVDLRVQLVVYPHLLASSAAVVEWVKGTSLTRFQSRLSAADYAEFLGAYRERLLAALGERAPYLYTFKRILFWARRPR